MARKRRQSRGSKRAHAGESRTDGETPDGEAPDGGRPDAGTEAAKPAQPDGERLRAGDPRPKLSADALLALSEMRSQGFVMPGERVVELGANTSDQDRDRLIAATMAQVEMQEAIYRVPAAVRRDTGIKAGVAGTLLFVALMVGVWPPGIVVPDPPSTLTERDALTGLRVTLLLQAQQIEAFRVTEDRLPVSLEEAGAPFDGVRYLRSGNRVYQLVAYRPDGEPVIFDSAAPAPEFDALVRSWLSPWNGA